jgi:hypothetical protein
LLRVSITYGARAGNRSRSSRNPHHNTIHGIVSHGAFANPNLIQESVKLVVSTFGIPAIISDKK